MRLAFRLARRELRGGVRSLWIVVLCLALGVGVIASVGTLRAAVNAGLDQDGRALLGGDLEIEGGSQPLPASLHDWLHAQGAETSDVVQMRSILVAPSGERQLVDLKAVDRNWPLVGQAEAQPEPARTALDAHELLAEKLVLDRLGLKPGDSVRLGVSTFRVGGVLTHEPDRVATASLLGPRVMISLADLPATGLVVPGAMMRHAVRIVAAPAGGMVPADGVLSQSGDAAPNGTASVGQGAYDPRRIAQALPHAFPDTGWRVRDPHDAAPGVARAIDQIALFLTLVGLTSLLVGGIGVANGVRAWLDARARTIATLRCLGASPGLVFTVCLIQVMALALAGIVVGLLLGATLPLVGAGALAGILPVPPVLGVYPAPLMLAAAYGVLIALCFALWPLGRAAQIPGGALFRDGLMPDSARPPWSLVVLNGLVAALLVALTIATAHDRMFALYFCAAAGATLTLFRAGGWFLTRLAGLARRTGSPAVRLGIGNLSRPGTPAPMILLSAGLGLSTLATVALIQGNMQHQIEQQLPVNAPSFFFIDIQSGQMQAFQRIVREQPGPVELHDVPSLRARVVAVDGVPAEKVRATPETAWALRGDRGLTYAATPPDGTRLVAGSWWPPGYDGAPLVSFDAGLAKGWHIGVGDVIRVNVLGRDIDLKIASLRDINWQSLGINFFMVASPGLLSHAPHTHIASVRLPPAQEGGLLRAVTDALPNVTGIRVQDVLGAIADLLAQIAAALTATGAVTLLAGAFVLMAAVAAGQRRRIQEAVILKTLGATRAQIRAAWLTEFGLLGLLAGLIAALVGSAASFGVTHYILHTDWIFLPRSLFYTLAGALAVMLIFGYAGTATALRARPAPLLRHE